MVDNETRLGASLLRLRNLYKGQRLFVVGSGPSLRSQMGTLPRLNGTYTFACNRLALWPELPFKPTFYACNLAMVERRVEPADPPFRDFRFLVGYRSQWSDVAEGAYGDWVRVIKSRRVPPALGHCNPIATGFSMAYVLVQIGFWLGFREFYLLGCEQTDGEHIVPNGILHRSAPNIEQGWADLKKAIQVRHGNLIDCTPGGRLNGVLNHAKLETLL